ncbi:MAG TPA: lactonase family protein [Roseiflexaceae bacterium]|nr:lactonase family protein [Roseiflexaceae bacterium]
MTQSNQHLVLVGSYAAEDQPGIYAFLFDEGSGTLAPHGTYAGIANPSFLALHPNGRWLYAVSELGAPGGSVCALQLEREPWRLEPINAQPSGGEAPCHLRLQAAGNWLLVSNYSSGSAEVLPILPDGALGAPTDLVQHHGSGPNPARQDGPHAHSAIFSPDERFAIVADLGLDKLMIYAFDQTAGKLGTHGQGDAPAGAGPRHTEFHPNGTVLYVANELGNSVTAYDYDAASSGLSERQTLPTLPEGAPDNTVADIHLAPSGERLYASNRGHDSLAVYRVAADGQLEQLAIESCGGACPRNFALAPGGKHVLVANQNSSEVVVLSLDRDGVPGEAVARVAVPKASCVIFA